MKRIALVAAASALLMGFLSGCNSVALPGSDGRISIVCAAFSEYDWTRELTRGSDNVTVTYLLDSGIDLHNYQPSARDILTISSCDLFIYTGGGSESWVDDVLRDAMNKDMQVLELMDVLGSDLKEEELKEGMEAEEEDEDEGEPEYDEHVWLSIKNARSFCVSICESLCGLDPENSELYRSDLAAYDKELAALDEEYAEMAENAAVKTILFGDRFPFRYLTDDYDLDYYAAFAGCSAETEASFDTIVTLANKADELMLDTVFIIESSDDSLAKAIIMNSGNKERNIETLNSLQSVTGTEAGNGTTYISLMRENLNTLKKVLE